MARTTTFRVIAVNSECVDHDRDDDNHDDDEAYLWDVPSLRRRCFVVLLLLLFRDEEPRKITTAAVDRVGRDERRREAQGDQFGRLLYTVHYSLILHNNIRRQ